MKRRAQIVGTVHPAGLMRAQVRVLPDWNGVPDDDSPGGIPVTHRKRFCTHSQGDRSG